MASCNHHLATVSYFAASGFQHHQEVWHPCSEGCFGWVLQFCSFARVASIRHPALPKWTPCPAASFHYCTLNLEKKSKANQRWVRRDGLWALEIWRSAFERVQKGSSRKQAFFLRLSSSSNSLRTEPQLDISSFGVMKRCRTSHFNIFQKGTNWQEGKRTKQTEWSWPTDNWHEPNAAYQLSYIYITYSQKIAQVSSRLLQFMQNVDIVSFCHVAFWLFVHWNDFNPSRFQHNERSR